ncbi:hypothetical protein SLEP1_g9527 [Rubroshorea leprosula]|uniref:Uncharacterized protein n=1 Tax=Rubroshorea leprosula TaxID=152421 RepID=A0AAV5IGF6_9ROSI|nr:hypothetical protein SLEP1_g9527 [Rubroshorea leprosula]
MGAPYQYFGLRQGIPHSLSDPFEPEADEANAQPSREPEQIIESAGFPHHVGTYCVAETHEEYLPEKPSFSAQDLYQRYGIVPDVIPRDGVTAYETEYHTPQLPKERDKEVRANFILLLCKGQCLEALVWLRLICQSLSFSLCWSCFNFSLNFGKG